MNQEMNSIKVLDDLELIVRSATEEIAVESRLEETLEIYESIRFEQESINFVDRLRNTEGEIQVAINDKNFPLITGEIRFTSDDHLVLANSQADYFISNSQICFINRVDNKAIFRIQNLPIETTTLWIKNVIDQQKVVSVSLLSGIQIIGKINRFGHDHLDFQSRNQNYLLPIAAIVLIRSNNSNEN